MQKEGRTMKKLLCVVLALLMSVGVLVSCGSKDTDENNTTNGISDANETESVSEETEPEETDKETSGDIEYEEEDAFGSFDFAALETSLKIEDYANDWSGVVFGKTKEIAIEKKGYKDSKCIALYSIGTGADNDLDLKYENDTSAIINWTGAEQVWYYIDGSQFGDAEFYSNFAIQEQNADENGEVNGTWQAWAITEGTVAHIYDVNSDSGWVDVTCVNSPNTDWDPARIPLPAGFKGWVAVDIASLSCYWENGSSLEEPIDLVYMNQFNWSVEGSEASVGGVCYVDSFSIVGTDVENGTDCPVSPMKDGAKWLEVWSLENFVASEPKNLDALKAELNKFTFMKAVNDWAGVVPEVKSLAVVEGKGTNGSKALAVTANSYGTDADCDVYNTMDSTAVTDWTGAEQIWFWLDATDYGTTEFLAGAAFAEENVGEDGNLNGTGQAWAIVEGATAHLYDVNKNEGWTDVTCVNTTLTDWDPGRIPIPAGFKGWVAVDVASMRPYWASEEGVAEIFDLKNVNQFNWSMETSESAVGKTLYVDSYAVVGTAVNGGDCPVSPLIENAKFLEVWGFEGFDAE